MAPETPPAALLFDFDGTLLDSFPAHYRCFEALFAHFGIPIDEERFLATYSPNWYHTYELLGLPREQWEQADALWLEEARKHEPGLFPSAARALEQLQAHFRLGLVTSGSRSRVQRDLERTGIAGLFEVMVTGDEVAHPKPAPDGLEIALRAMDVPPAQAWYIGDAQADLEMARAAGVPFFGVLSRFDSLSEGSGCPVLGSVYELVALLARGESRSGL